MFRFPPLTPYVRVLLIGLVASFVVTAVLQNFVGVPVVALLALNTTSLSVATLWQVFTHVLVTVPHAEAVFRMLFSMFVVWMCLAPIEHQFGTKRAVQLSVVAAVATTVGALAIGLLVPNFAGAVLGPGGVMIGSIGADAALMPPHSTRTLGNWTYPAKYFLWFWLAVSFMMFLGDGNGAALAGDLAAAAAGYGFARGVLLRPQSRPIFGAKRTSGGRLRLVKREDDDDEPKRWLN